MTRYNTPLLAVTLLLTYARPVLGQSILTEAKTDRSAPLQQERDRAAASLPVPLGRFGHVEKAGTGKPVLVLVPCLGCDWQSWDEFMERNENRYTMYAVTWPGMGDTPLPQLDPDPDGTPLWDNLLQAMKTLIEEEHLSDPVLIGHSAAGPYVVHFAHRYPELVGKVVSVDATITNGSIEGYSRKQRFEWADEEMVEVRQQYDYDDAWRKLNAPPKGIVDLDRRAMYGRMWLKPPRENVLRYWQEWLRTDAGAMLPELRRPLLTIHAIGKNHPDPAAKRKEIQADYDRAPTPKSMSLVFVEQAGHTIWENQPTAFDRIIADFVAGRPVSSYSP